MASMPSLWGMLLVREHLILHPLAILLAVIAMATGADAESLLVVSGEDCRRAISSLQVIPNRTAMRT